MTTMPQCCLLLPAAVAAGAVALRVYPAAAPHILLLRGATSDVVRSSSVAPNYLLVRAIHTDNILDAQFPVHSVYRQTSAP